MDRPIIYPGQIPLDSDLLATNKNAMLALGALIRSVLGTSLSLDGLACTPNSPAALNVLVGPGSIHSIQNVDGTAYGTLPADTTNQTMKQGLLQATQTLSCPAPATTGHSIVYLVQAAYQDVDTGPAVLPYYNASNPAVAWSGPNNTGVSQNTVRKGTCLVGVKAGISATTGTQAIPAPDAGYVGLYAVTVANGQTTITSGDIQRLATAPFIDTKLPAVLQAIQSGATNYAQDSSVAANTVTVSLSPIPAALTAGMCVNVKVANSVTGATVMNVNGLGNVAVVTTSGAALTANAMVANGIYELVYDANGNRWQLQGFTAASATGLLPANNLSDVSNPATALANLGGTIPTGVVWDFEGSEASVPGGWLALSGKTIGSASSGATARANADTWPLFELYWTDHTDTTRPIYTSAGAVSTRGASAAADFAAHKRMSLGDDRGRMSVGKDDMGGAAANRVTNAGSGITGTTLGASGGAETVALNAANNGPHTHVAAAFEALAGGTSPSGNEYLANAAQVIDRVSSDPVTASSGSGTPHNNMPPSVIRTRIVKL